MENLSLIHISPQEAGSIGIIGGADGPTALFTTARLAEHLLGPIAVAAYSYMALVPVIQPPIMKALTTKKERQIVMKQLRPVSKTEKIIFPIAVTTLVDVYKRQGQDVADHDDGPHNLSPVPIGHHI